MSRDCCTKCETVGKGIYVHVTVTSMDQLIGHWFLFFAAIIEEEKLVGFPGHIYLEVRFLTCVEIKPVTSKLRSSLLQSSVTLQGVLASPKKTNKVCLNWTP